MKQFDVQTVEIAAPFKKTFDYIADPSNLPKWTNAFKTVNGNSALLETPKGAVNIGMKVNAAREQGTVDWVLTFPDGSVARAYSRVVPLGERECTYSFNLMAPPLPLEELEGALKAQSEILREELAKLSEILAD